MSRGLVITGAGDDGGNELTRTERSDLVKKFYSEIAKRDEKYNIRFDELELDLKDTHEIAVAAQTKHERVKGYTPLKELGREFKTPIGSKYMGKLLRAIKVAEMSKEWCTSPYQVRLKDGTARLNLNYVQSNPDLPQHYLWNPEKVKNILNRWLEKRGLLKTFYAATDEKELEKIIRFLHNYRVELNSTGDEQELQSIVMACVDEEEGKRPRR